MTAALGLGIRLVFATAAALLIVGFLLDVARAGAGGPCG